MAYSAESSKARQKAIAAGELVYPSQEPCKNDHMGMRYVKNRNCVECKRQQNAAIYRAAKLFMNRSWNDK